MSVKKFKSALLLILLIVGARPAFADSTGGIVNEGNKLYQKGQYQKAINEYDRAMAQSPEVIEPRFNKADAYYRLDDLQQAIDLYREVSAESRDMGLVEKAKYNLGNSFFQQGTKQRDSNLQKAVEDMQTAIGCWRQVLDINPANEKAAKNIEVARLTIKDIIDQINRQKQQQEQQEQQQKQNQEDLKQLLEQQKSLADKTQQTKRQADSNSISQQQAAQDYTDIAKQQSDLKDKTAQTAEKIKQQADPNKPDERTQKAAGELSKAVDNQKDAAEKLDKAEGSSGKQSQDEAAKNIEEALKALSEKNEQGQQPDSQQQQEQQQQQQQSEPNQPAESNEAQQQQQQEMAPDATAEEILDREQKQKDERQILQNPGFRKVDKDW